MSNEDDISLTKNQIDKLIKELVNRYGRDENEMLPIGEIRCFLMKIYLKETK